jgi:hypothetical protein
VDELYRSVGDYAALHAERLASLPRPRVVLVRLERAFGAMLVVDSARPNDAAEHDFVMRFRPGPDSPLSEYRQFDAMPRQPVWPGNRNMLGGRICVQPGVRIGAEVLYEPWTCLPTSEAVDFGALQNEPSPRDD